MSTIIIVYVQKWKIVSDYSYSEDIYSWRTIDSTDKIRKIFYKLDDALSYIESIENQKYPPSYDELQNMDPYDEDPEGGFYLYWERYPIE